MECPNQKEKTHSTKPNEMENIAAENKQIMTNLKTLSQNTDISNNILLRSFVFLSFFLKSIFQKGCFLFCCFLNVAFFVCVFACLILMLTLNLNLTLQPKIFFEPVRFSILIYTNLWT